MREMNDATHSVSSKDVTEKVMHVLHPLGHLSASDTWAITEKVVHVHYPFEHFQ